MSLTESAELHSGDPIGLKDFAGPEDVPSALISVTIGVDVTDNPLAVGQVLTTNSLRRVRRDPRPLGRTRACTISAKGKATCGARDRMRRGACLAPLRDVLNEMKGSGI